MLDKPSIKQRMHEILGKEAGTFSAALVQLQKQSFMLQKCDPASIIGAALTAAALRLPIDPNLGHAYVVPYGKDAQFQLGYKGLIQLALRSGQVQKLNPVVIPHGALVNFDKMAEELVVDFKAPGVDLNADPDGYAVFLQLSNGFTKTAFMTRDEVDRHARRFSKSYNSKSSPWQSDFDAMAIKTIVKRTLLMFAPLSIEQQTNIAKDQGIVGVDGEVNYLDNPTGDELQRADFSDATGEVTEVTEEDLDKTETVKEDQPKPESEPDEKAEKEKAHNIELIENAILDLGFNGEVVFEYLKGKKLAAASAADFKDIPAGKIAKIAANIGDLLNDYATDE